MVLSACLVSPDPPHNVCTEGSLRDWISVEWGELPEGGRGEPDTGTGD